MNAGKADKAKTDTCSKRKRGKSSIEEMSEGRKGIGGKKTRRTVGGNRDVTFTRARVRDLAEERGNVPPGTRRVEGERKSDYLKSPNEV